MAKIKDYIMVAKPRLVFLLVFTGLSSAFIALKKYDVSPSIIGWIALALILGTGGTNALTCYIDRDIDAEMSRTKNRPIPSGKIKPKNALIYSLILICFALILSYFLHPLASLFMLLGVADSALVYNAITKRKSPLNIILGAPAGGMPVLVAWSATAGKIELIPFLMALLIIFWTPIHIWSLALYYSDDYEKVKVPMLPVVTGPKTTIRLIALFSLILVEFSLLMVRSFRVFYLATAIVLGTLIVIESFRLLRRPDKKTSWQLFKLTSPYLFLLFLAMILDTWLF